MVSGYCDAASTELPRIPVGFVFVFVNRFGPLPHAASIALVCLGSAMAGLGPAAYIQNVTEHLDYILGGSGRSVVVGFGADPPARTRHESASCLDLPAPCGRARRWWPMRWSAARTGTTAISTTWQNPCLRLYTASNFYHIYVGDSKYIDILICALTFGIAVRSCSPERQEYPQPFRAVAEKKTFSDEQET